MEKREGCGWYLYGRASTAESGGREREREREREGERQTVATRLESAGRFLLREFA
jgi:hypothetical protein